MMKGSVHHLKLTNVNNYNKFNLVSCMMHCNVYLSLNVYVWKEIQIDCAINMSIGWAPDMIGWACTQPFPTLATPLVSIIVNN